MAELKDNRECFVMMPIEDCEGYESGHFRKVYEKLIKPALRAAGMKPVRADELSAGENLQTEVIKRLINSPVVVCDLSSLNKQISLGLGIRKAYSKPTLLLWDDVTPKAYYLENIECIDYANKLDRKTVKEVREKIRKSLLGMFDSQA